MFFAFHRNNLLCALFGLSVSVVACTNAAVKDAPTGKDKRTALDEATNVEVFYSQNAKVKGKLTAPLMYVYQGDSSYTEFPKSLHVDFYNDSLLKESQLDARYGKDRSWENKVYLRDCVVVINVLKGDTLRCQELWWDKSTQKFYTNKPARYSQKDKFTNYGKNGLEAKQDLSDLVFYENSGTLPVPKDSVNNNNSSPSFPSRADSIHPLRDTIHKK